MRLIIFFLLMAPLFGVDGIVRNGTTEKPQANASVTLTRLGQGMEPVGTVTTDAEGRFQIPHQLQPNVPYLLQAMHQGVNYNRMIQPGPAAPTSLQIVVYDALPKPNQAKVTQDMILLEPSGSEINVSESVIWENRGTTTFFNPQGTLRFQLPEGAGGNVRVSVVSAGGMPITRPAEKVAEPNIYAVKYPVKPGETRFDIQYRLPAQSSFETKILHGGGSVRLIAPKGVKFISDNLQDLGPEPRTQATIYELKGSEIALKIEGTGTLRAPASGSGEGEAAGGEADVPQIEEKKPRIYERVVPVLGLVGLMLGLGTTLMLRNQAKVSQAGRRGK